MKAIKNFFPALLGLGFLIAAGIVYANGAAFRDKAENVTGTVTGMSVSTNSEDITSYCPQIQFTTQAGQDITYHPNVCSTSPEYENGDQVEMYYNPENPEEAQMKGFWTQYGIVTLPGGIGLALTAVGLFIGWLARPAAKKNE